MATEIERKFLVANNSWRHTIVQSVRLQDGLIAAEGGRKVRVRIAGDRATLAIKGERSEISRDEFEYEIPLADAERLLSHNCMGRIVRKTRHLVQAENSLFEVDEYEDLLSGILIAEIELSSPDAGFFRPDWLGEEITGKEEYRKINLFRSRQAGVELDETSDSNPTRVTSVDIPKADGWNPAG